MPRPRTIPDEAILDQVLALAHRIGPQRLTFQAVAKEVGLSPAALVQRFGNKHGMLLAADKRGVDLWVGGLDRAPDGPPLQRLVNGLVAAVDDTMTHAEMANSVAMLQLDLAEPDFHAETLRGARAFRAKIEERLREAQDAGEIDADVPQLAKLVETTYHGAMIGWAIHREGSLADWMRDQVELVLRASRVRSP
jgi:AcrR family transcriptional regulator